MQVKPINKVEHHLEESNDVGLIDLLTLVVENIKLLVAGSTLAALFAVGVAHFLPKSYVSQAILIVSWPDRANVVVLGMTTVDPRNSQAAALMTSPRVLDPVIGRLKLSDGRPVDLVRKELMNQVKATAGVDGTLLLDVASPSAERAQVLANAVIDSWLESTAPTEEDRKDLKARLAYVESSLNASRRLMDRLSTGLGSVSAGPQSGGETSAALIAAADLQARLLDETTRINRLLSGQTRDVVKQAPTLATTPDALPTGLIALLSAIATAIALMLWICIVQAWKSAALDPDIAPKVMRLRSALGMK